MLAAICLVGAFALGVLLPPLTSLGRVIAMWDHDALVGMQDAVRLRLSGWAWENLFMPVLARPSWLMPLALGLVLGGIGLTLASRRGVSGSPRWRN